MSSLARTSEYNGWSKATNNLLLQTVLIAECEWTDSKSCNESLQRDRYEGYATNFQDTLRQQFVVIDKRDSIGI